MDNIEIECRLMNEVMKKIYSLWGEDYWWNLTRDEELQHLVGHIEELENNHKHEIDTLEFRIGELENELEKR